MAKRKKVRKPRKEFSWWCILRDFATIEGDIYIACGERCLKVKEARRLAKWLERAADWLEQQEKKGK